MPLLETRDLTAFYGDFQALYGIDTVLGRGRDHRDHRRQRRRQVDLPEIDRRPHSGPPSACCSTASRSAARTRPRSSGAASRWCRRGAGCFPRSPWRRTC